MRKAFLILAHKNPSQLERLVKALHDQQSCFFIHIDQSASMELFENLSNYYDHVKFVKREKAEWARFGLVQATLNGLRAIAESPDHFQHIYLISGQDYPLQSNAYLTRFAENNKDRIFLEYFHLPAHEKWQPNGGLYRVNKYFFGFRRRDKFLSKALNFLSRKVRLIQRKMYADMKPYAGSMWWILNDHAMRYILEFVDKHPGYVEFHQHTFAADEVFFQTILLNATDERIRGKIINRNHRFIKWKDQQSSHPETIDLQHMDEIAGTDALFARKFDHLTGSSILDKIDLHRNTKRHDEASV